MKKLLFGTAVLMLMASCGSKNESKLSETDSATAVEDTATVEATVDTTTVVEVGQDSPVAVAPAEEVPEDDSFAKSIPNPKKIYWDENCGKYLKSLGFEGSTRTISKNDGEYAGNYTLTQGDKKCTVSFETESNGAEVKVTIDGDEAALNDFYKKAKKMAGNGYEWFIDVKKNGNTVKIEGGGA